jgi:hypothetical protein
MNGAELAARYAFPPNSHGYCGNASFRKTLRAYLDGDAGPQALEMELKGFRAHYEYLSLIARENGMKPFDTAVVRAFWTGNRLLDSVSAAALRRFILRNLFAAKQPARARKLCDNLPAGILPHHSFNALYVNFVTDKVERSIENYDSCCVTAGEVLSVSAKSARIRRNSIGWDGGFVFRERVETAALELDGIRLIGKLGTGDLIAVHWGMAIEKLKRGDFGALKRYTERNIEAVNNDSPGFRRVRH